MLTFAEEVESTIQRKLGSMNQWIQRKTRTAENSVYLTASNRANKLTEIEKDKMEYERAKAAAEKIRKILGYIDDSEDEIEESENYDAAWTYT